MSLISSIIGSDQTSKAVSALTTATGNAINEGNQSTAAAQQAVTGAGTQANQLLGAVAGQQVGNLSPYTNLGATSANNLNAALQPGGSLTSQFSFDPTQIAQNPDYQFQLQQGLKAVQAAGAATGTLGSTATLKGLTNYAGGLASSEIGQAYNQALSTYQTNYGNTLNSLGLGAGIGLSGTNSANAALQNFGNTSGQNLIGTNIVAGNYGMSNANNIEKLLLDQGAAKANGSLAQGNIWGGFASSPGVVGAANTAAGLAGLG